ncbi:hypothetical protein EDB87DRAFT_1823146 [Lactarius vividus]|nr:hypothetical protein EDB87DRAFT_1823146 [Lactarius vividus]
MDPSKANPREYLRQAIDAEIKSESLEDSIRALRYRRNALAPVSSLSTEIIADIFSLLYFTCLAGATEMLARARMAPLYLEARIPVCHLGGAQLIASQKELQTHVSHIRHLSINAGPLLCLSKTLEGLVPPAPILEYLSLSNENIRARTLSVPDTLFYSATPKLSCLKLCNCIISWKSSLLKGLRNLEILMLSVNAKPSLAVWLDALDKMPQLKTLVLHSASPITSFPFNVERTITLPFLTHLGISAEEGECAVALAHLVLPALTWLCLTVKSSLEDEDDVQKLLPYITRHAHGPQDAQPLQSMLIHGDRTRTDIFAWPAPDTDLEVLDPLSFRAATLSARVRLSVVSKGWLGLYAYVKVIDAAMTALPLDNLTIQRPTWFHKHVWHRHAPRWPLLPTSGGLREVLLQDVGERHFPLLPSLIKLGLIETSLGVPRNPLRDGVLSHGTLWLVAASFDDDNLGAEYETFSDYDYETDSFTSDDDSEEESYSQMEEDMPSSLDRPKRLPKSHTIPLAKSSVEAGQATVTAACATLILLNCETDSGTQRAPSLCAPRRGLPRSLTSTLNPSTEIKLLDASPLSANSPTPLSAVSHGRVSLPFPNGNYGAERRGS